MDNFTKVFGQNCNNYCENAAFQLKKTVDLVIETLFVYS